MGLWNDVTQKLKVKEAWYGRVIDDVLVRQLVREIRIISKNRAEMELNSGMMMSLTLNVISERFMRVWIRYI